MENKNAQQVAYMTTEEMKDILLFMVNNNKQLQKDNKIPTSLEITGDSGLGKTSIVKQVAEENDLNYVKINLSQIEEIGDLVGIPKTEYQIKKSNGNDQLIGKWVTNEFISYYLNQGWEPTNRTRTSYSKPAWIEGITNDKGGILTLDDYSRADLRFMQAIMEVVDRQEYISWKLPKGWTVVLTSNPDNGDYIVTPLDSAQKTRYTSCYLKWDAEVWGRWAEHNGVDSRCINFVLKNKEIVTGEVNPRALTTFFNNIAYITNFDNPKSKARIQLLAEGSIGADAAMLFSTFIDQKMDKVPSPDDILFNFEYDDIADKLLAVIGKGLNRRADIASIIGTRILNKLIIHVEKGNNIDADLLKRIKLLLTQKEILSPDIALVLGKKLNKLEKFDSLLEDMDVAIALTQ